jgi:hypothetical protein
VANHHHVKEETTTFQGMYAVGAVQASIEKTKNQCRKTNKIFHVIFSTVYSNLGSAKQH